MANNTRVNEIQDKFLQAMDILNAKALDSISYDKTITCTIENDKDKKDGKYEVSDGSIIFTAYSTDERYHNGDVVYVTVPQGDYENQKMIIGKKTSETDKPFNFIIPFDTFFSMTGNIVNNTSELSLIANGNIENSEQISINTTSLDLINYTRLAIKADFRSWIKKATEGNYGINITLYATNPNTITESEKEQVYYFQLDNTKMYGNPYNFETYYTQEIVLDISGQNIGKINRIDIEFRQEKNFKDSFGNDIPSKNGEEDLLPNLFVKNIEIHFGYDISIFTTDFVEIYTHNSNSYKRSTEVGNDYKEENAKEINMRWVHIIDGEPVDMIAASDKTTESYEVRWYRYRVGAVAADEYCGIYWEKITDATGFNYIFNPDVNKQQEKIKAIILCNSIPYRSNELIFENEEQLPPSQEAQHIANALLITCDDETNGNYMIYGQDNSIKDTSLSQETRTLSAWFDANNNGEIETNEIIQEFDNLVWYFPTQNTMITLLNGGSYERIELISYEKGKYYIEKDDSYEISNDDYNENIIYYKKINEEYQEITNFYSKNIYYYLDYQNCKDLKFDSVNNIYYIKNDKEEYEQVININSEMYLAEPEKYYIYTYIIDNSDNLRDNTQYYEFSIKSGELKNVKPQYKIASYYSPSKSNNTIRCQYTLNGVVYTTEKEFTFGKAGTMGTDQTLVVDFIGDKNAIDINTDEICQLQVQIYDNQNKLIADSDIDNIKWDWYYRSDTNLEISGVDNKRIITLDCSKNTIINGLYIIQVSVGKLTTYFPIPVKNGYSYIKGPTEVIYQSNGEPNYNREAYKLYNSNDSEVQNVEWRIVDFPTEKDYEKYYIEVQINSETEYKELYNKGLIYISVSTGKYGKPFETQKFDPNITYYTMEKQVTYTGKITNNKLQPLSIYVEDAVKYGVQACINKKVVWTQPILVLKNQWPNAVINEWDGNSLILDKETQTIISAAIAAGKKNGEDNTFSGVMIGDWGGQDVEGSITKQTGVYGFHHGAMSYALKEDGTAFFGKDGRGRIHIDGNSATLYSDGWNTNGSVRGMQIDLDAPKITLSQGTIEGQTGINQIKISAEPSISKPIIVGENFSIEWDGTIYAYAGEISGWYLQEDWKLDKDGNRIEGSLTKVLKSEKGEVYLDGTNGEIRGATIKAGILRSNNGFGDVQNIKLCGTLDIYAQEDKGGENYVKTDAYISGFVYNTNETVKNKGLSLTKVNGQNRARVYVKDDNASLSYENVNGNTKSYIASQASTINLGVQDYTIGNNNPQHGYLSIHKQNGVIKLSVQGIDAINQEGIYARFA